MRKTTALGAALVAALAAPAFAGASRFPVPVQVIYPGDRITNVMLKDSANPPDGDGVLSDRGQIVGKVAKRTLLPDQPIHAIAIEEPRAVSMGALIQLVYRKEGVSIATTAQALQNGYIGQVVQVRNIESGLIVSGAIQADGSVLVDGG